MQQPVELFHGAIPVRASVAVRIDGLFQILILPPYFNHSGPRYRPREQARVIGLLVARVDYSGETGKVVVTFHASGIKSLAGEAA